MGGFLSALGGAFKTLGRGFRRFGRGFGKFVEKGGLEQFQFPLSSSFEGGPGQIGIPFDPRAPLTLLPPPRVVTVTAAPPEPAPRVVEPPSALGSLLLIGAGMAFTLLLLQVARLAAR